MKNNSPVKAIVVSVAGKNLKIKDRIQEGSGRKLAGNQVPEEKEVINSGLKNEWEICNP